MRYLTLTIALMGLPLFGGAQNCNAFLHAKDTLQYEACVIAEERGGHYQYSREFQEALDKAIEKCPYFSYAYLHKSVAYLKSGDFVTWKALMDKAVELNTKENLGYRGWCRYQFFRDYRGAIADIERLDSLISYDIGHSAGGEYHLHVARALCYKALGNKEKAMEIIEAQLSNPDYSNGLFDHLHLGVLYLETGQHQRAIESFQRQSAYNELAENQYYLGMTYKAIADKTRYRECLQQAKKLYLSGRIMRDSYTELMDKIYLTDIEAEIK